MMPSLLLLLFFRRRRLTKLEIFDENKHN